MAVEVIRAGSGELDALVPLFDAYRGFYEKASDPDGGRAFLAARMAAGESVVFLALHDGVPAGFTQLYPLFSSTRMARLWLLNDLFVDAGARGQGVGAALLARARQHAEETGGCELMLETAVDNPARRLYERAGYNAVTDYVFYSLPLQGSGHS
jgi:GNAT superfamily N-acetyltransferase